MKSYIVRDVTARSPLKINRRFGAMCRLHVQGRRISQARSQHELSGRRRHVPPTHPLIFNVLNSLISQKIELPVLLNFPNIKHLNKMPVQTSDVEVTLKPPNVFSEILCNNKSTNMKIV
jgi:hypothetical protein